MVDDVFYLSKIFGGNLSSKLTLRCCDLEANLTSGVVIFYLRHEDSVFKLSCFQYPKGVSDTSARHILANIDLVILNRDDRLHGVAGLPEIGKPHRLI